MSEFDFDLFTIGAGSGGVAGSRRAASYGARVAVSEAKRVGGTCVLRGCVPKKLLVYGSHFADEMEDARGFGWTVNEPKVDWGTLIEQKNKELDRLNGIYVRMLRDAGCEIKEGFTKIVGPHTVEVNGQRFTSKHILIATGSRPVRPEMPGAELGISSDEALDLPYVPPRVLVVGGGYIAVEFAGIWRGAGSDVTIAMRGDNVLRGFDQDVREAVAEAMQKRGIRFLRECLPRSIEREESGRLSVRLAGGEIIEADVVLFATGREPVTSGLGLEEVGVKTNERGAIVVDTYSRTSVPSIFAVGDVTDRINLTPVAIAEARAVAETLFHDNPTEVRHDLVPSAIFSQPPAATVGLSESEARRRFGKIDVYRARFRPMKYTLSGRDEKTMMKLIVCRATDKVLGAHMVGADAPEIIQGVAIALQCGATKAHFDRTIGIHPTAAEEFVTMRDPLPEPEMTEKD